MGLECWLRGHELTQENVQMMVTCANANYDRTHSLVLDCANCHKPIRCTYKTSWNNIKKKRVKE